MAGEPPCTPSPSCAPLTLGVERDGDCLPGLRSSCSALEAQLESNGAGATQPVREERAGMPETHRRTDGDVRNPMGTDARDPKNASLVRTPRRVLLEADLYMSEEAEGHVGVVLLEDTGGDGVDDEVGLGEEDGGVEEEVSLVRQAILGVEVDFVAD